MTNGTRDLTLREVITKVRELSESQYAAIKRIPGVVMRKTKHAHVLYFRDSFGLQIVVKDKSNEITQYTAGWNVKISDIISCI